MWVAHNDRYHVPIYVHARRGYSTGCLQQKRLPLLDDCDAHKHCPHRRIGRLLTRRAVPSHRVLSLPHFSDPRRVPASLDIPTDASCRGSFLLRDSARVNSPNATIRSSNSHNFNYNSCSQRTPAEQRFLPFAFMFLASKRFESS